MTLTAKLQFGNNDLQLYNSEYLLVNCHVHSSRQHNAFFPIEAPRVEWIEVTIVAEKECNLRLQEWYITQSVETGRILFEMTDVITLENDTRQILFEDAVCYSMEEKYDINDNRRRVITLRFVAQKITIDDVDFKQY